ncbi:MAG: TrkA C-terminal domain-containing protein [bacterium]
MDFWTDYFVLFLIIALGMMIGRIKFKGISLDVSAVIFVALFFGHFGVRLPDAFQTIGLLFFIYAIGVQAGPGFFDSFKQRGFSFVVLTLVLVLTGVLVTIILATIYHVDRDMAVGLFTGALTSTPGLAAAVEASSSKGLASIGYGIAYPFGVIGVILFVYIFPKIFRIDLKKEEQKYVEELGQTFPQIIFQHFVVNNKNIMGKTIGELKIRSLTGATVSRIKKAAKTMRPSPMTVLEQGDLVRAVGTKEALEKIKLFIGPVTKQSIPVSKKSEAKWFFVTNKKIVNKSLVELNLFETFGATVTRIRRSGVDISPHRHSTIKYGDKLFVVCTDRMNDLVSLLGNEDKKLMRTDFLPIALGLIVGIILGSISIPIFMGIKIKLGLTGGVLIAALVLSRLGKVGPIIWNVSGPANQFMKQLGLLFFLAVVGTKAGASLMPTIRESGMSLFAIGAVITLLPMLVTVLMGRFVFKLNILTLLGLLTGGMTSTPGLSAVDAITESSAPHVAYAAVYPFATVLIVICSQFMCG